MKRQFDPAELELMDRPQPVSIELERDLRSIRQLNRWFGSHRVVRHFVRRWIRPGARMRIIDLATGSGDIPRLIVDLARKMGANVEIDALDRQSATLEIARGSSSGYPEISYVEENILQLKPPHRYDIVLCSLVLHHFSEGDAVCVLRRCRELSRKFVLVSDLRRGLLTTAGVYFLTALIFREPMTRYDARLSAARAFSFAEFNDLAGRAGWKNFGHKRFQFARQAIWLEKADN
jgi:2-polyprenyl-3-methyl-5-hydroxy-6-metoxy-1,4-benzoquinol methylase